MGGAGKITMLWGSLVTSEDAYPLNKMADFADDAQELEAARKPRFPSWCPACGCSDRGKYPYALAGGVVGCQDCFSVWKREELEGKCQMQKAGDR